MSMKTGFLVVAIHGILFYSALCVSGVTFRRTDLSTSTAKPLCRWYSAYNGSSTTEIGCARLCAFESGCYSYQYYFCNGTCVWCLNTKTISNSDLNKTEDYVSYGSLSPTEPFFTKYKHCGGSDMCIPKSCGEYREQGYHSSGVYMVLSPIGEKEVYCDMTTRDGGWMVFLRRVDGSVDFYRDWNTYEQGFGDISHEFWMGNELLAALTSEGSWEMHVDLGDFQGTFLFATYSNFYIDKGNNYSLHYQDFHGNVKNNLKSEKFKPFSTYDRDNDKSEAHCAEKYKVSWWFHYYCHHSGLTGTYSMDGQARYARGVFWLDFTGYTTSLKFAEMKIRPTHFDPPKSLYPLETDLPPPRDCSDLRDRGHTQNGVYTVYIQHLGTSLDVYCDMVSYGGGWQEIQRRYDGSEDFNRDWTDYEDGFGRLEAEFWFGNKNIASITEQASYRLSIYFKDFGGVKGFVEYGAFSIDRNDQYRLWLGPYIGYSGNSLGTQKGFRWSTFDRDNDENDINCAEKSQGGWWHSSCNQNTLNGVYDENPSDYITAMNWDTWHGFNYALKVSSMKIRRAAYTPP